jgi:hypothetical protein
VRLFNKNLQSNFGAADLGVTSSMVEQKTLNLLVPSSSLGSPILKI